MITLLYVSISKLSELDGADEVARIVAGSTIKNAELNVTGALVFTSGHFAQALEGPAQAVDGLMEVIRADVRHTTVTIVDRRPIDRRRFGGWWMAYSGRSTYVAALVSRLHQSVEEPHRQRLVAQIYDMMRGFVAR